MKLFIIEQWLHHKNRIGLILMLEYLKNNNLIPNLRYIFGSVNNLHDDSWDIIYSPATWLDSSKFEKTKIIFGPHFSVFPNKMLTTINNTLKNAVYIQPSDWARDTWINLHAQLFLPIKTVSFAVDIEKFKPDTELNNHNEIFVYFKSRSQHEMNLLEKALKTKNVNYKIFSYLEKYQENDYLNTLKKAKYGIVLGRHESQGFAIEEALSCNVPLLVWSCVDMSQESVQNFPKIPATTVPYWDERCGEIFYKWGEFENSFNTFFKNLKLGKYAPRDYIVENLSAKPCAERLLTLINEIK